MNKKIFAFIFILFLALNCSAASQLTLQINESSIIEATHVYDNDNSIAFVDVFIINAQGTTEHSFTNVTEGQELLGITEEETAYYNFMDDDGTEIGLGFLIPISGIPSTPPVIPSITVIQDAWITPSVYDEENGRYQLLIEADVNENHSLDNVEWIYSIEGSLQNQSLELTGGPNIYSGILDNLTGEKIITSKIRATDSQAKIYEFNLGKKIFNLMAVNPFCNYSQNPDVDGDGLFTCMDVECLWNYILNFELNPECRNIEDYASAIDDGAITAGDVQRMFLQVCPYGRCSEGECIVQGNLKETKKENKIFLQGEGQSSIQLKFTDSEHSDVYVSHLYDDDATIGKLDVYYDNGNGTTRLEYFNVSQNQYLGISIPEDATSYYSFSDYDGTIIGIGFFLEISEPDAPSFCELYPQDPSCVPAPDLIESATIKARLNETEKKYYLDFEVKVFAGNEIDWVKIEYNFFNKNYVETLTLTGNETTFTGSLGPFENELITFSRVRAKSEENTDTLYLSPRWDYLLVGMISCEEICWDNIDNDADGFIDEGCAILPQLYPRITSLPEFVLIGKYFTLSYAIGNSGGEDANSFKFKTLFEKEKIREETINSLKINESKEFEEELFSGIEPGRKTVKIEVDILNQISESNESDNILNTTLWVRLNQFDVNYNYNETYFLGDIREIRLRDLFRELVSDANCEITYPSGKKINLVSDEKGVIQFTLLEGGTHNLKAEKEGFETFEGNFEIEAINVGYRKELEIGDVQLINLKTKDGKPVVNATVTIISPSGKTVKIETNEKGQAFFVVQEKGTHAFIIKRKDVSFYNSRFDSLTTIEQISLVMNQFIDITAGKTLLDWVLFIILIALSVYSARTAYKQLKSRMKKGSTREIKLQLTGISMIAGMLFIAPIAVKVLFGIGIAFALVLIEVAAEMLAEYMLKQKEKTKKIKVE
ncbi:MAG: hypothetical protein JW703_00335 [Candidatus Diapherotrites archaeon]|nr:hypothetical protein [Candidatus Diapherotrites archaeon]